MKRYADEEMMKMFLKTGDPFYYVARNVFKERRQNGAEYQNTRNSLK